jgi:hypothetical protein
MCSIAAQYAISNKVAQLHPAPSSSREVSPNIVIQDVEEGAKGGMKRRKQHRQETATTADDEGDINKQVGNSVMVRVMALAGSHKHQARPPMDHFQKLLRRFA